MPQDTVYGKVWIGLSSPFFLSLGRASACLKEIKFHMNSCFLAFIFKPYETIESVLFAVLHALGKHDVPLPVSCRICGNLSYQKKPKVY